LGPSFKVELDRFAHISTSTFDVGALGCDPKFRATSDKKVFFLGDEYGETVRHKAMLTDATETGKQYGNDFFN
jgi:hypothetical protein